MFGAVYKLTIIVIITIIIIGGMDSSVGRHHTENPGAILTQVQVPRVAGDCSPSQLPVQTLLQCPYSPRVQSHALMSVRMLLAAEPLFGHTEILHQSQEWVALLLWPLCFTQVRWHKFPARDNEIIKKDVTKIYIKNHPHHLPRLKPRGSLDTVSQIGG